MPVANLAAFAIAAGFTLHAGVGVVKAELARWLTRAQKVLAKIAFVAADAFKVLREFHLDEIPVVDAKGRFVGMVDVQDLLDTMMV